MKNNKGIGLVEAVLAIAFAIVLVVALLSLTTLNVQNSLNVTERQEATKDTSNILEKLRELKDANFANFFRDFSGCTESRPCYFSNNTGTTTGPCPLDSPKKDYVCFSLSTEPQSSLPVSVIKINIVSYYEISKSVLSSATETIFTNWRTKQ